MKKIAVFVEGLTEEFFLKRLLIEIFGKKNIKYEVKRSEGKVGLSLKFSLIEAYSGPSAKWFFLIVNCGADNAVKSNILDQRDSLIKAGYIKIIGLRDVYPQLVTEIHKLRYILYLKVPQKPIEIKFILCVMEIESWFLSECLHYLKISSMLTGDFIKQNLGFNPCVDDMQTRPHPAIDLDNVYKLAGKRYTKERKRLARTVDILDYSELYFNLPKRIDSLNELITELDSFF